MTSVLIATNTPTSSGSPGLSIGVALAVCLVISLALMGIFSKAGEQGWKGFIPIYNYYILLKIVGRPGWWLLLYFIPIVGFVIAIIVLNDLSAAFGHGTAFTVGLVLLSVIFLYILWLGSSTYRRTSSRRARQGSAYA